MNRKILPILLTLLVISMPNCTANNLNNEFGDCNMVDLTNGAVDANMYSIYSYIHSKGIPIIGVKLSPNDLKENYLAQYVDGNDSYFIQQGSKNIKLNDKVIDVGPNKFTGYAIISGDEAKNIDSTPLTPEEMNNIKGKISLNGIPAIIAACPYPRCGAALLEALRAAGYSLEWCATHPEECYAKLHHLICRFVKC